LVDFTTIFGNMTMLGLVETVVGLIILWTVISIPVWLAGKAVTGGKATFGEAMLATLAGPIVYVITLIAVSYFLGALIGSIAYVIALVLAFIAWIWVYKASFETSWLRGFAIAILAVILFIVIGFILNLLFGFVIPTSFFPTF
jgi:hypothetical protein